MNGSLSCGSRDGALDSRQARRVPVRPGPASPLGTTERVRGNYPKGSLLTLYFRRAAIEGMTDPSFSRLQGQHDNTLTFIGVLAHEWAPLAPYVHGSPAYGLAWLTCLEGDSLALI